jgi:methionyl-tRNA formyltransferase
MENKRIKTIFMGTPEFGARALEALLNSDFFDVVAVVTQPDKKVGRGLELATSAIKKVAQKYQLKIYQPEKIRHEAALIKELKPDLIVVAAYGQIIPLSILNIPVYGCINVHGSLLPKYRGAACLQAPILHGEKYSGVTIMKMDENLDTGPILAKKKIKLTKDETASSLHDKLAELGAKLLIKTLKKYIKGGLKPKKQNSRYASYVKMLKKEDGHINWHQSAEAIEKLTRAFNPWPGAYGYLTDGDLNINQVLFKLWAVRPKPLKINKYKIGQLFIYESALAVQCGQNALVIIKLQLEGRKVMEVDSFLRGNQSIIGNILK